MGIQITKALYTLAFICFVLLVLAMVGTKVPALGYQVHMVLSGSMEPTIPTGSIIVVVPASTYVVGDIVTYQRADDAARTTHRIIEQEIAQKRVVYTMQGDANNVPDQRPVYVDEIEGKVLFSVPFVGYIVDFIRHPAGFVLLVLIPAFWILYEEVQKIRKEAKKVASSQEE